MNLSAFRVPHDASSIVALGDSITDGHGATTNGNDRWTDDLVSRLQPNYRPKPYPGRVTLFLPTGIPNNQFRELRSSWSRIITAASLEVVSVPGGHYSLVEEPHVRVLAAEIRARLDEAARSGISGNANHSEPLAKENARTSIPI